MRSVTDLDQMGRFWDERAREDPLFFVDNREPYRAGDLERFFRSGSEDLERFLDLLGTEIHPEAEIVEIGCGIGRITRELAHRGAEVKAIDISSEMLRRAEELNPDLLNVEWIQGDGRRIPLPDESCDLCHSHVVFQHIPDPRVTMSYVREIGRVLRIGGEAAIGVSNEPSVHALRPLGERLRAWVRSVRGRGPHGQDNAAWRGSAVDLDSLIAVAEESGMEVERVTGAGTQYCLLSLVRED